MIRDLVMEMHPLAEIVSDERGNKYYRNPDGMVIPIQFCRCGVTYDKECPVEQHQANHAADEVRGVNHEMRRFIG